MTRPIEGVGTNVAAFVGLAEEGPFETPDTFDGWGTDEDELFDRLRARPLGRSLKGFFENGGTTAVAVRVEDAGTAAVWAGLAALDEVDLVNLVVLPAESADREDQRATVAEAAAFCERRRAMLLVDPPSSWTSAEQHGGSPSSTARRRRSARRARTPRCTRPACVVRTRRRAARSTYSPPLAPWRG